jgi:hypothetical protein
VKVSVQVVGMRKVLKLVKEWPDRALALRKQFLYRATVWAHQSLLDHIPPEYATLRDSLRVSKVLGASGGDVVYAIEAVARNKAVGDLDVGKTVLYVQAKPRQMRALPIEVGVLIDHGPWTAGTLPFSPDPKVAVVVSRVVGERAARKVENARRRDRRIWKRKLERQGVRVRSEAQQLQMNRGVRTLPDVGLESAKLEFGLGGVAARPHWRPTVVKLASRQGAGIITRRPEFKKAMTLGGFGVWRSWPKKSPWKLRLSQARQFVTFQKRLGVRVPR